MPGQARQGVDGGSWRERGLYGSWLPRRSRAVNQILYFPRKEVARCSQCNLRAARRATREREEEEETGRAVAG